jgi:hypothetical protein
VRRFITLLSLAALAAVAVTAFIGAGSASAAVKKYVLCKALQTLCSSANLWGTDVKVLALSTEARLLSGVIPVVCHSHVTILTEAESSTSIKGKITELTWTNCKTCTTVTTTKLPTGELKSASGDKATLLTTSETVVSLKNCPFGASCTARANDVSLEFTGGTIGGTANAKANEAPVTIEGGALCGSSGKWDAGSSESKPYTVTSVNGLTTGSIFVSPESHA